MMNNRGDATSGSTWTAPWVLADFDASGFIVGYAGGYFPAGRGNLRLTYQGGYVAGTEPADSCEQHRF